MFDISRPFDIIVDGQLNGAAVMLIEELENSENENDNEINENIEEDE